MKLTIEVDADELRDVTARELHLLLSDALGEFQDRRGPTSAAYVDRRYPPSDEYAWLDRAKKVRQVDERKRLAEILRTADFEIRLFADPPADVA